MKKSNLVGMRFGKLVVIAETASQEKHHVRWVCQCDCGNTCIATRASLRSGKKQSCNCLRSEIAKLRAVRSSVVNIMPGDGAAFNQIYSTYKWQAAKRGFTFELSKEEFRHITSQNCHYCNKPPLQEFTTKGGSGIPFIYNGIDRVDNMLGYLLFNSVPCCGVCNDMKRARSKEQFIQACEAVALHQNYKRSLEIIDPTLTGE